MSTSSGATTMAQSTDRIQKTLILRAPRSKVWLALTDSAQLVYFFQF
jgi:uncharacterized protein YndB with AHSA1/START domain